jgi:hypothetical protein
MKSAASSMVMMTCLVLWEVSEMDEIVFLLVEKNQYDEMIVKYHKQPNLAFKQVSEQAYKVFNRSTGRNHNMEFGIDEVV